MFLLIGVAVVAPNPVGSSDEISILSGAERAELVPAVRGEAMQLRQTGPACVAGDLITGVDVGQRKLVAFTYDDGPWAGLTRKVMAKFEARGMRATFFVVGQMVRQSPDLARDIVNRGHTIANHSMTHSYSPSRIAAEVAPTNDLIERITGVRPTFFRSPGLTRGAAIQSALANEGMCNIFSTADLRDYTMPRRSSAELCASFDGTLHPGFVVLLHDGGGAHENTIGAIDCMLNVAEQRGYAVVGLDELLREGRHYFGSRQISNGTPALDASEVGRAAVFDDLIDE